MAVYTIKKKDCGGEMLILCPLRRAQWQELLLVAGQRLVYAALVRVLDEIPNNEKHQGLPQRFLSHVKSLESDTA